MNALLELATPWGYVLIFLLALLEGAALVGLFLPGETAMILGGVLVYQGRAALGGMLIAGCLGSALGDSIGYWIGRRFGAVIRDSGLGRSVGDERWRKARAYLTEKGGKAVFFGRFLGFLRTLVPPVAGSTEMPYRRFVTANAPAAALWAGTFIALGVAAGASWRAVNDWAGRASLILLIVLAFGVVVFLIARWLQHRQAALHSRWRSFLDAPTVRHLRDRFRPQLDFLRRRLDPERRFGLVLTLGLAVAVASAVAFGAVIESLAKGGDAAEMDAWLLDFFRDHRVARIDSVMQMLVSSGEVMWIAGLMVVAVTAAAFGSRRWGWLLYGGLLLAGALFLDDAVRWLLELLGVTPGGLVGAPEPAFPSPQANAGGALVGGISYVVARTRSWRASVWTGALTLFAFFMVSTASIYSGKQTPSGITAGFFLGLLWAAVTTTSSNQLAYLWRQSR